MGLTIVLNRPWFSSGTGEQLVILTAPCPDPKAPVVDSIAASFAPNEENSVSAWGVLKDWLPFIPKGAAATRIHILGDNQRSKEDDDAAPSPDLPNSAVVTINRAAYWALLFTPRFNDQDQQWFVNLSLSSPPAYGAVVRLLTARFQQHAITSAQLSDVSMCDFALLRPDRAVTITTKKEGLKKLMQIQIVGIGPTVPEDIDSTEVPRTVIEVRHFETRQDRPHYFAWQAGSVVPMDKNLPNTGNILWQATFPYPWFGGQLVAQEWEIWPSAEDTKITPLPIYADIFPI
jgi:hypothetical protein